MCCDSCDALLTDLQGMCKTGLGPKILLQAHKMQKNMGKLIYSYPWVIDANCWQDMVRSQLSRITSLFCCTVACTSLSRCIHKGSVRGHFERCFYFHWSVCTSPLISLRHMKMGRKPKNIMLKAYDYSVMFYFSSDVFDFTCVIIRDLSIAANWNLALRGRY